MARFTRFCVGRSRRERRRRRPLPRHRRDRLPGDPARPRGARRLRRARRPPRRRDRPRQGRRRAGRAAGRRRRARGRLRPRRRAAARRFAAEHGGEIAPSAEAILALELDVLAPCAAGGLIDDALARSIDVRVVAGAANNPLTSRAVARTLAERGILYVPDFLANCGGLIHVSSEWYGGGGPERGRADRARDGPARPARSPPPRPRAPRRSRWPSARRSSGSKPRDDELRRPAADDAAL